jgi:hypothetical protein
MFPLLLLAAFQQAAPAEPMLWRDLRAGMPKSEVKARYPKYLAELSPGCPVRVLSTYKKGGLHTVLLISPSTTCAESVRSDFVRQYGEPAGGKVRKDTASTLFAGGTATTRYYLRKDETWIVGPVRILFITLPGNGYNIVFSKASDGLIDSVR